MGTEMLAQLAPGHLRDWIELTYSWRGLSGLIAISMVSLVGCSHVLGETADTASMQLTRPTSLLTPGPTNPAWPTTIVPVAAPDANAVSGSDATPDANAVSGASFAFASDAGFGFGSHFGSQFGFGSHSVSGAHSRSDISDDSPAPHRHPGLPAPAVIVPLQSPALAGEGQWIPAGRSAGGHPVLYTTTIRPTGSDSVAGVAWMDTRRLRGTLYSGSISPGNGPWTLTAPVQPEAALSLVCAFNGGFKLADSHGGYYAEDRYFAPLVADAASLVITRDGTITVGQWGRDVSMSGIVMAVRQNLTLLVDQGAPVPGLSPTDNHVWGSTVGGVSQTARSGVGVTAASALVYVSGPSLNIVQLAQLLVAAGVVRGMEFDINPEWDIFTTYTPLTSTEAASPANGVDLLASMPEGPSRFFNPRWGRDFIAMSTR